MTAVLDEQHSSSDRWVQSVCKMCLHSCGILCAVEDCGVTNVDVNWYLTRWLEGLPKIEVEDKSRAARSLAGARGE